MLAEDRVAINNLIKRIESWPSAVEQLGGSVARPPTTSSSKLLRSTTSSTSRSKRGAEQPRLSSSLRAPVSRKSSMMASSLPQRPSVYRRNPTVGPDLGPGSHELSHGNVMARASAASARGPSPEFRAGKLRPLFPARKSDPCQGLGGVSGEHGIPTYSNPSPRPRPRPRPRPSLRPSRRPRPRPRPRPNPSPSPSPNPHQASPTCSRCAVRRLERRPVSSRASTASTAARCFGGSAWRPAARGHLRISCRAGRWTLGCRIWRRLGSGMMA